MTRDAGPTRRQPGRFNAGSARAAGSWENAHFSRLADAMRPSLRNAFLVAVSASLALLVACSATAPQVVRPTSTVAYPPTRFLEVLNAAPSRPYEEIGVVDAIGEPGSFNAQLLERIKAQAQAIGADAIVVRDVSRSTGPQSRYDPATGAYLQTNGEVIPAFKGIAIKYR
jgi:hypothetical protein